MSDLARMNAVSSSTAALRTFQLLSEEAVATAAAAVSSSSQPPPSPSSIVSSSPHPSSSAAAAAAAAADALALLGFMSTSVSAFSYEYNGSYVLSCMPSLTMLGT